MPVRYHEAAEEEFAGVLDAGFHRHDGKLSAEIFNTLSLPDTSWMPAFTSKLDKLRRLAVVFEYAGHYSS